MNKMKIDCDLCAKKDTCSEAMDYPICLSSGECPYYGERADDFHFSLFEPADEYIQLFPKKL